MLSVQDSLALLGLRCKDKITGMEGVVDSISFDLYGCVQAGLMPKVKDDMTRPTPGWYDVNRLEILDVRPVMARPAFVEAPTKPIRDYGPAEKAPR